MKPYQITATAEAENTGDTYETNLVSGAHQYSTDEPVQYGGKDKSPSPGDYLCGSLAACKVITLRMYANRKGWSVDLIKARVELTKTDDGRNVFLCDLAIQGDITADQKKRMLEISKVCPIQKLLGSSTEIITVLNQSV